MGLFNKDKSSSTDKHPTVAELADGEFPGVPLDVSDSDFETVIKRFPLVIVDCWAPRCGPCKMIAPFIDEFAGKYKEQIVFGKLNTDGHNATAMKFGVMSIPTLLVFKDGELVDQITGAMPKPMLDGQISKFL